MAGSSEIVPVLLRIGDKLLALLAARVREGLADTWVERAIATTQQELEGIVVDRALATWCQSDPFHEVLRQLLAGERDLGAQEIVDSFIQEGEFHLPDPVEAREVAGAILDSFVGALERELYLSPEGPAAIARRSEVLHASADERLTDVTDMIRAVPREVVEALGVAPDELEGARSTEERVLDGQVDAARDLLHQGKAVSARRSLERIREKIAEVSVSPELRFRVETNLGAASLQVGEHSSARAHFMAALRNQPESVKALANAAHGELLAGDSSRGLELARKARETDPREPYALAILLLALHRTGRADELHQTIERTPWLSGEAQCAAILGQIRLEEGRLLDAAGSFRDSLAADPENAQVCVQLAVVVVQDLQPQLQRDPPLHWRLPEDVREALEEAEELLTRGVRLLAEYEGRGLLHDALAARGAVRRMLERGNEAEADCDRVLLEDADHRGALRNKGLALLERDPEAAANALARAWDMDRSDNSVGLNLARSYGELGRLSDARSLLEAIWNPGSGAREQIEIGGTLLRIQWEAGDREASVATADRMIEAWAGDAEALWMVGRFRRLQGDENEARERMREAFAYAEGNVRDRIAIDLADIYIGQQEFAQAAAMLETVVDDNAPLSLRKRYAACLFNAERLRDALTFSRRQRGDGPPVQMISEVEALVLERIGDLARARELLLGLADAADGNESLRIRAASIALAEGNPEGARTIVRAVRLERLRDDPHALMQLAHTRLALGEADALPLAYRARRLAYDDPGIHLAYVAAFLGREQADAGLLEVSEVAVGTAVHLERGGESPVFVVEDDHPDRARSEIAPSDPLAQRLLGSAQGDTVVLKQGLEDLSYRIQEVQSKYVYAFQDTLLRFTTLFPDHEGLHRVETPKDDVTKILSAVDQRSRHVLQVMQLYEDRPLPFAMLARLLGRSPIDVWHGLRLSPDSALKVSTGLGTDTKREWDAAESGDAVVDLSAALMIHELGMWEVIRKQFETLLVPQAVLDEINRKLDGYAGPAPSRVLGKVGERYVMEDLSPEGLEQQRSQLEVLRDSLRAEAQVVPAVGILDMAPERLTKLDETIGSGALAAILVAKEKGAVLIADDLGLRMLARGEWEVEATWTQPVLQRALERGLITEEAYSDTVRQLAEWRCRYVLVRPQDLLWALAEEGMAPTERATRIVEFALGNDYAQDHAVSIAGEVVRAIWLESLLLEQKLLLLDLILASLSRDRAVPQVLEELKAALSLRLTLLPTAEKMIFESIDLWARQAAIRRGLLG